MEKFCDFITKPEWWSVIATIIAAIVAAWITNKLGKRQNELQQQQLKIQERQNELQEQQVKLQEQQNKLQEQQAKQQEYELYRRIYAYIWELDVFNKTMLQRLVALLVSNEDKNLRLKLIDDIWKEYEKKSDEFTECTIDIELKQCGEGLDVKYYYDALQASREIIIMFKYFVDNELLGFKSSLADITQIENHTTPPEEFIDIIIFNLFKGRNSQLLRNELIAFANIVQKTNQAKILEIIKDRITPTNTK